MSFNEKISDSIDSFFHARRIRFKHRDQDRRSRNKLLKIAIEPFFCNNIECQLIKVELEVNN